MAHLPKMLLSIQIVAIMHHKQENSNLRKVGSEKNGLVSYQHFLTMTIYDIKRSSCTPRQSIDLLLTTGITVSSKLLKPLADPTVKQAD